MNLVLNIPVSPLQAPSHHQEVVAGSTLLAKTRFMLTEKRSKATCEDERVGEREKESGGVGEWEREL